jgi:DNA replication protein DnaC
LVFKNAHVIDEVGYLSYANRHADLLCELISRRYEHHGPIVTAANACQPSGDGMGKAAW